MSLRGASIALLGLCSCLDFEPTHSSACEGEACGDAAVMGDAGAEADADAESDSGDAGADPADGAPGDESAPGDGENTPWHHLGLQRRMEVIVEASDRSELTSFPLLVRLPQQIRTAGAGGLVFTDAAGTTLHHDIDHWGNDAAAAWVLVPVLPASEYRLWVYYDPITLAEATSDPEVWAAYAGVWHMTDAALSIQDATAWRHVSTTTGSVTSVAGAIGGAAGLGGSTCITVGSGASDALDITGTRVSVEAWVKRNFTSGSDYIVVSRHHQSRGEESYYLGAHFESGQSQFIFCAEMWESCLIAPLTLVNTWTHLAGVRDGATLYLYVDGELADTLGTASGSLIDTSLPTTIGCRVMDSEWSKEEFWVGAIDEVRISATPHSGARIATHVANVNGTLGVTFAAEQVR